MAGFLVNWKTTTAGLGAIFTALGILLDHAATGHITPDLLGNFIISMVAGVGLLFAKDYNISGTK